MTARYRCPVLKAETGPVSEKADARLEFNCQWCREAKREPPCGGPVKL